MVGRIAKYRRQERSREAQVHLFVKDNDGFNTFDAGNAFMGTIICKIYCHVIQRLCARKE
jgi:hypothetical protein